MKFFTATILEWKHLLKPDPFKEIIVNSMQWMVENKRAYIYGFVIMPNHFHLLWHSHDEFTDEKNQATLLSFTGHEFKKNLERQDSNKLQHFRSTQADRENHFWERRPYGADIYNRDVAEQKLEYMHNNPLADKWKLAKVPEEYYYSSAGFYILGKDDFKFITHYTEHI